MEQIFFTDVLPGGKIQPNVSAQLKDGIKKFESKRIYIKLGLSRKIRSLDQNKYYWGVVVECCREGVRDLWGESISKEQAHALLKIHANSNEKINELTDSIIRLPMPTHTLTTIEFCEYVEKCRKFLSEMFGITVADPDSQTEIAY